MSFQGDIAGLGLGELLQSLSRGGQDGVLRLHGGVLSASVGVRTGLLFLLPNPDDDEGELRDRCGRAWADDPNAAFEPKRREDIAQAARLETLYDLIESRNVHFRFEPGPVTLPENAAAWAAQGGAGTPWHQGMNVEYVLLEHARLSDESKDGGLRIDPYAVPRILDLSRAAESDQEFLEHCVGRSTVREIADRLGWTLLKARVSLHKHTLSNAIRFAAPRELLASAQHEWSSERRIRAAARLTGWISTSIPGPPEEGDAELILGDWEELNFKEVLPLLNARAARTLLRKLDFADPDTERSDQRWELLRTAHRRDNIACLHLAAFRYLAGGGHESSAMTELLRLMRQFGEDGNELRAQALLRLATSRLPSTPKGRTDLGARMLEMGMMEGVDWLINVAREHVDDKRAERAIGPLKEVLRRLPGHRAAGELLQEAKLQGKRRRQRRTRTMVGSAIMLLCAAGAVVQVQLTRAYEMRFDAIVQLRSDPIEALRLLEEDFGEDDSWRVQDLRSELIDLKADLDENLATEWNARYGEVYALCETGPPLEGLTAALTLKPAPKIQGRNFPGRSEVLNLLANRLETLAEESSPPLEASEEELEREAEVVGLLAAVMTTVGESGSSDEADAFHFRISEIYDELVARRKNRELELQAQAAHELENKQDLLLAAARGHAANHDYERSMQAYERLLAYDKTGELEALLSVEMRVVRVTLAAVDEAVERASAGDHEGALEVLRGSTEDPSRHFLPMQIDTHPSGARVHFADGRVFSTPFTIQASPGEQLRIDFSLLGYESARVVTAEPANILLNMHRLPDREWNTGHRIEATPVPIGEDHLVADRHGIVARLGRDGRVRWKTELDALSGIARTPAFLPGRPGHVLVLSEDGKAWIVDARDGDTEGPWEVDAKPIDGPTITRRGVSVLFSDGRLGIWRDRLQPQLEQAANTYAEPIANPAGTPSGLASNMAILRRSARSDSFLASPWTDLVVDVESKQYSVRKRGENEAMFTARRGGSWSYLAWEAPNALLPEGRLWVSDDLGLRAYVSLSKLASQSVQASASTSAPTSIQDEPPAQPK